MDLISQFLVQQFDERSKVFRAKTANVNRVAQQPSVSVYENTNVCLIFCLNSISYVLKVNVKSKGLFAIDAARRCL